jgi:hypothetical protein
MENVLTDLKTREKNSRKKEKQQKKLNQNSVTQNLLKKNEPTRKIWEKCIRSLASRNIYPLAKLGKCNSNLASTILKQLAKMAR